MIYGERIRQARALEGLTQKALAERIGTAQSTIAHIETGRMSPSTPILAAIAKETGVHPSFFERVPSIDLPKGSLKPRERRSISARERDMAHEYARLCVEQARLMAEGLNLPQLRISHSAEGPKGAAVAARDAMEIELDMPVANLFNAMEIAGVFVLALPLASEKLDAFSTWIDLDGNRPMIAVSDGKTGDRLRFTAAHELGHIMMHGSLTGNYAELEVEANQFAQELLLPERPMRERLAPSLNLTKAARLKLEWGVSVQAIVRRARDLQIITERHYRYLFQQIGAMGWRKREPSNLDIEVERPRMFRQMVELSYDAIDGPVRLATSMRITQRRADRLLALYSRELARASLAETQEYGYSGFTNPN